MTDKKKYNQPYYTEPVEERQSISQTFPPRGSFINIPEDILFNSKSKTLDTIIEDKIDNIGSDLYKSSQNAKK